MKTVRLVLFELGLLKRTIIIIGLILTIFSGAFLSVVSVLFDVPLGLYNALDDKFKNFECLVYNVTMDEAASWGGESVYAELEGVTSLTDIVTEHGTFSTQYTVSYGSIESTTNYNGYAVSVDSAQQLFAPYAECLTEGKWLDGENQICVSTTVVKSTQFTQPIAVGDQVTILNKTYTVVGLYSYSSVSAARNRMLPARYYYVSADASQVASTVHITYPNAKTLHNAYQDRVWEGKEADASAVDNYLNTRRTTLFDNVDLANAFFLTVAIVLGIILVFILYSLIAIFYRQRKTYICRLKLFGAHGGTIGGVYCSVTVVLLLLAVLGGSWLSIAFNVYFMNLCTTLFGYEFASHFYYAVPAILFVALSTVSLLIYSHFNKKINKSSVVQEIRND